MEHRLDLLRDPVSSSSHFLTALLAVVATLFLYRLTPADPARRLAAVVFGLSAVVLYTASGLYHALQLPPDELRVFQKIDMSAIYLLIAGTCTPMMVVLLHGRFRTVVLAAQWLCAVVGIAALWLLPKPEHSLLVGLYLGMGWLGAIGIWHYWRATGWRGVRWAIGGSVLYTIGAAIELAEWPVVWTGVIRSHELLHFCDIGGTACHLVFIVGYVVPYRTKPLPQMATASTLEKRHSYGETSAATSPGNVVSVVSEGVAEWNETEPNG
jgi:hemolysin III